MCVLSCVLLVPDAADVTYDAIRVAVAVCRRVNIEVSGAAQNLPLPGEFVISLARYNRVGAVTGFRHLAASC